MIATRLGLRRGDEVEVRPLGEILSTLDARGTLDGVPFMPEMRAHIGRRFRVWRRADRVCVEGSATLRRLRDTVLLEGARCDGAQHDGCQRDCLILWKEAWLRRPGDAASAEPPASVATAPAALPTRRDGRYVCQSTELGRAGTPLGWWQVSQYARDLWTGNLTPGELWRCFSASAALHLGGRAVAGSQPTTPNEALRLQPGDLVEVKDRAEIAATLDARGRNRGLEFAPGMDEHCGGRYRVVGRVERMIDEQTGEMRALRNTVVLEDVRCSGRCARGCPRSNALFWREIWLRRAE